MQLSPKSPSLGNLKPFKRGPGRRWGSKNRYPLDLKRAAIAAVTAHGSDGRGTDGLTGYFFMLAGKHHKAFAHLLGKMLPLQLDDTPQSVVSQVTVVSIPMNHYLDPATIAKLRPEPSVIEHEHEPEPASDDRLAAPNAID